jgi:four helix bundle protein
MIKSYKDLEVYNLSYALAMDVFQLTRKFPKEELYSLTSQIVRSSRSISSNIVEGWAKRIHEKKFKLHLVDALGSTAETLNWIQFAKDCGYGTSEQFDLYTDKLDKIGRMLTKLHQNWKTFDQNHSELGLPTSSLELPTSNFEHRD